MTRFSSLDRTVNVAVTGVPCSIRNVVFTAFSVAIGPVDGYATASSSMVSSKVLMLVGASSGPSDSAAARQFSGEGKSAVA